MNFFSALLHSYILTSLVSLILSSYTFSQYKVEICNSSLTDGYNYEFDICVQSTGADFYLSSYQTALSFNSSIKNGGTLSFNYVEGTSELNNIPTSGIGLLDENGIDKLCFASNSGNDLITSNPVKIGRFRLTNTNLYSSEISDIKWVFSGEVKTIFCDKDYNDITLTANYSNLNDLSPMPVELTSFDYKYDGTDVTLNWNTATEVNNYGFEIQRKDEVNNEWAIIGFVNGAGNSSSIKNYEFKDTPNKNGLYFYRLKSIDTDGQFEFSNELSVNVEVVKEFKLCQNYPNPFNPSTRLQYSLKSSGKVLLEIYNSLGELVTLLVNENQIAGVHQVDWKADNLSSGIYISRLTILSDEGSNLYTFTSKMQLLK